MPVLGYHSNWLKTKAPRIAAKDTGALEKPLDQVEEMSQRVAEPNRNLEARQRNIVLDVVRGFALLGVFVENIQAYIRESGGAADVAAQRLVGWLADGNFYPLYCLLFGYGVATQMERSETAGQSAVGLHLRRMSALLLVGMAFFLFLDKNVVFIAYALVGLMLPAFRGCSSAVLLATAAATLLFAAVYPLLEAPLLSMRGAMAAEAMRAAIAKDAVQYHQHLAWGGWGDLVADRAHYLGLQWSVPSFYRWWVHIFAMFLLGMWTQRRGVFTGSVKQLPLLRGAAWMCGVVAAAGIVVVKLGAKFPLLWFDTPLRSEVRAGIHLISSSAAAACLAATLTLLCRHDRIRTFLRVFSYPGRLSLTNFVLQSVFMTFFFCSFGLGYFEKVGAAGSLFLVAGFYALQAALSVWWLQRFTLGPLEWTWRVLVYGRNLQNRI